MSLLEKASLVVTPNAYKESKLYSVIPNTTLGDMDVVRATTATRVNEQGLIEVVPRNIILYSEQFDNVSWSKNEANVISNGFISPNGIQNADKIIPNTNNAFHTVQQLINATSGQNYSFSIYAKANGYNYVVFNTNGALGGGAGPIVNLSNGTIAGVFGGNDYNAVIENVGNDWYKISFTFITNSTTVGVDINIFPTSTVASYSGNGTSGCLFWGYQLEQGSTATTYFPTTTRLNIPRIDYTNGSCPSLLVEPQRTNLITYSSLFSNAAWGKQNTIITDNSIISPDGTLNASKFIANSSDVFHAIYNGQNAYTGNYTFSVYAKKGEYNFLILQDQFNGTFVSVFNLNTGTIVSGSNSSIQNVGNGWYRCIVSVSVSSTLVYPTITIAPSTSASFIGDNISGAYIYGAQLEQGSYATSYIPTIASSVTRNADVISKTGISSLIGQTEGTLFADFNYKANFGVDGIVPLMIYDTINSNRVVIIIQSNGTIISEFIGSNYVSISSSIGAIGSIGIKKLAFAYKSGDCALYLNGNLIGTSVGTTSFSSNAILINSYAFNANYIAPNPTNSAQIYKTRLTNTELAQLTTL